MEQEYSVKRKHKRFKVSVKVLQKDPQKNQTWETMDIAEGGLSIQTATPPFVGEILQLEITLGKSENVIDTKAEVVWRREGHGCGLRFFKLTAKEKEILTNFLNKLNS